MAEITWDGNTEFTECTEFAEFAIQLVWIINWQLHSLSILPAWQPQNWERVQPTNPDSHFNRSWKDGTGSDFNQPLILVYLKFVSGKISFEPFWCLVDVSGCRVLELPLAWPKESSTTGFLVYVHGFSSAAEESNGALATLGSLSGLASVLSLPQSSSENTSTDRTSRKSGEQRWQ